MSKLMLAEKGRALLPIVVSEGACDGQLNAARDLAHYLKRITKAKFSVEQGHREAAINLGIDEMLEEEAFAIRSGDMGMTITGGSLRGLFYGVYGFLEDVLGVGFYTHDMTKLPCLETLTVENVDIFEKPALEFRQLDTPLNMFADWRAHNRINGPFHGKFTVQRDPIKEFGGMKSYVTGLFVHTFNKLVDPEVYFDEHPEYFALVNGERVKHRTQPCLTNPEVIALATENVRKALRTEPESRIISVSQNDWYNPCQCPECTRVDEEEGSRAGTMLRFVNAIAEGIEEEFPQVVVDTLAYKFTRKPPKITKPRPNVCVRLCDIECCFAHPLETCHVHTKSYNNDPMLSASSFQEDLIGWGKICDRIYIWDYVTDYMHYWMPYPNFQVLAPNIQFFVKNGVKGVYPEGNYQSVSPDLAELRSWLLAKLMWNPDYDVAKGMREFCEFVYGDAAEDILNYIDLLSRRVTENHIHFGIKEDPDTEFMDKATLTRAQELVASAQAKTLSLAQRLYVEKVALSVEFATVGQQIMAGHVDDDRIDAMMEKARTLGITYISEREEWHKAHRRMLQGSMVGSNAAIVG